ncbi:lamin tail domain-containing protein [Candidatus Gracilibacteria bacterium]|nr:lamin tail domain-containing protein [Candidatus Gracilibacteria bacterium]
MRKITLSIFIFFNLMPNSHAQLRINEIHPNPTGKDSGKEWIEIYNPTNYTIPLENWQIDNGSKIYSFPEKEILPKTHFIYNLPLKNSKNTIIIFSKTQKDQLSYQKSKEGLSLSHVTIKSENANNNAWIWTEPSKALANPIYQELTVHITQEPQIAKEYYFKLDNQKIYFTENFPLLKVLLKPGTKLTILVKKEKNKLQLINYKLLALTKKEPRQARPPYIYLLIPIIILTLILSKPLYYKSSAQTPP